MYRSVFIFQFWMKISKGIAKIKLKKTFNIYFLFMLLEIRICCFSIFGWKNINRKMMPLFFFSIVVCLNVCGAQPLHKTGQGLGLVHWRDHPPGRGPSPSHLGHRPSRTDGSYAWMGWKSLSKQSSSQLTHVTLGRWQKLQLKLVCK